jgi:hypothetical protein
VGSSPALSRQGHEDNEIAVQILALKACEDANAL